MTEYPPSKRPKPMTKDRFLAETGQSVGEPLNYDAWYREVVARFPTGSVLVELGVYKGRSADFLVRHMQKAGKKFKIHLVDIMTLPFVRKYNKLLRQNCFFHSTDSVSAAAAFEDKTVDFVWIDADHSYHGVCEDVWAWLPKVKPGGVIAGHDYYDNPAKNNFVKSAIDELFPDARIDHKSWWHEVK